MLRKIFSKIGLFAMLGLFTYKSQALDRNNSSSDQSNLILKTNLLHKVKKGESIDPANFPSCAT